MAAEPARFDAGTYDARAEEAALDRVHKELAKEHKRDKHGCGFEEVRALVWLARIQRQEHGDHRIQVGCRGANRDQNVHPHRT